MTPYCSPCLDVWVTPVLSDPWKTVPTGLFLHVRCGRALEAIRTAPPTFEFEAEYRAGTGWAA